MCHCRISQLPSACCWDPASLPGQGRGQLSPHLDEAIQSALVELGAAHDGPLVHHPCPHHVHGVGGDGPRQPTRETGTAHTKSGQHSPDHGLPLPQAQNTSHWTLSEAFSNEQELHCLLLPARGAAAGPGPPQDPAELRGGKFHVTKGSVPGPSPRRSLWDVGMD